MPLKKTIIIILTALGSMGLFGCGNKAPDSDTGNSPNQPSATGDPNVPDNVIATLTIATPAVSQTEEKPGSSSDESQSQATLPEETQTEDTKTSEKTDKPKTSATEALPEEDITVKEFDTEAERYLSILNSNHVHAKFTEMYSFDGDELFSAEREYYINGDERIYINDHTKTLIRGGTVTFIDYDRQIFYSYPDEGDYGIDFGFEPSKYTLISTEDTSEGVSEVFNIEGESLVSTWKFGADGKLKVSDRDLNSAAFNYYMFEIVDGSYPKMDFTVPTEFNEVDAEDYSFFY